MKKVFICFIFLVTTLIILRCKSTQMLPSKKQQYMEAYSNQFKLTYFRYILKKSFNHSNAIIEVMRSDHSGFAEPLITEMDERLIDSLTTVHNELLIIDSIQGMQRAEGAKGKRP